MKEQSDIFEEFDVTMSVIESLLVRERDRAGQDTYQLGKASSLTG